VSANPIPAQGELCAETDNLGLSVGSGPSWLNNGAVRFKVGDGVTAWTALPWSMFITDGTYAGAATSVTPGVISFGTGAPTNSHGNNGDIYIRVDGGTNTTIYQRRAGSWVGIV
jgi:hypothetical protein